MTPSAALRFKVSGQRGLPPFNSGFRAASITMVAHCFPLFLSCHLEEGNPHCWSWASTSPELLLMHFKLVPVGVKGGKIQMQERGVMQTRGG